jgi:hypothetical protein
LHIFQFQRFPADKWVCHSFLSFSGGWVINCVPFATYRKRSKNLIDSFRLSFEPIS